MEWACEQENFPKYSYFFSSPILRWIVSKIYENTQVCKLIYDSLKCTYTLKEGLVFIYPFLTGAYCMIIWWKTQQIKLMGCKICKNDIISKAKIEPKINKQPMKM